MNFYATTPIYYVNDTPHIGHAYTTVLTDALVRFHKLLGFDTYFLTGVDEHGQKVQRAAEARGVAPQEHVDEYCLRFKGLWTKLGIDYNQFIRTTDPKHKDCVRLALQKLYDTGFIYAKEYQGWYSVGEERFLDESELVDGKDPIGKSPVDWISEKNYFFKMSAFQEKLIAHIEAHPDWILPDYRRNEILGFLKKPLADLCISRPKARLAWGIPLPFDEDFVTYVWVDALMNYYSAVRGQAFPDGSPLWPASVHLIGKDILTTHCVYWPTILMALDLPLPQHILAHGWWMIDGAKMSKTSGTGVNPMDYAEQFGTDPFRYFLIREMVVGQDSTFSHDAFVRRVNTDLANDLGNGLNRVHKLVSTKLGGLLPQAPTWGDTEAELKSLAERVVENIKALVPQFKLSLAVEEVSSLVRALNKYLEVKAPWKLAKSESEADQNEMRTTLYAAAEAVRLALALLSPVMPTKCGEGLAMLGCGEATAEALRWGVLQGGERFGEGKPLFPRIVEE
jgi:methionyl-tRNA synthetase